MHCVMQEVIVVICVLMKMNHMRSAQLAIIYMQKMLYV